MSWRLGAWVGAMGEGKGQFGVAPCCGVLVAGRGSLLGGCWHGLGGDQRGTEGGCGGASQASVVADRAEVGALAWSDCPFL